MTTAKQRRQQRRQEEMFDAAAKLGAELGAELIDKRLEERPLVWSPVLLKPEITITTYDGPSPLVLTELPRGMRPLKSVNK